MAGARILSRLRRGLRRWERAALGLYLAGLAFLCLCLLLSSTRNGLLDRAEGWLRAREARWPAAVDRAALLLEQGRLPEAITRLQRLERRVPGHRLKQVGEYERVLALLARAETRAGHKRAALAAWQRLQDFDPRNVTTRIARADAAWQLGEHELALRATRSVLEVSPRHLPSVERLVTSRAEAGDCGGALRHFEAYLDALPFARVDVIQGARRARVWLPADGRFHALRLEGFAANGGPPRFECRDLELKVAERSGPGRLRAGRQPTSGAPPLAAGEVRARLRARVPVTRALWEAAERCYRNQLAWSRLAAARARTRRSGGRAR